MTGLGEQLSGVRWRWVLAAGAVTAVSPLALLYLIVNLYAASVSLYFGGDLSQPEIREYLRPFASVMANGGMPVLYLLVTVGVSNFLTRASGAINAPQGLLLGFVSAVGIQLLGRAFGPFDPWELIYFPLLGVAGGWLGAVLSRGALARQEALYNTTDALHAVDSPREVAAAIGRNLAGPSRERVSLWRISPGAERNGDLGLDLLGSWAPGTAKAWPEGWRLDARRLPVVSDLQRRSCRLVRREDLPPVERGVWDGSGVRSALLVPLSASGGPDGLLVVSSRARRSFFDRKKVRAYLTVGAQAALALENLRLIEEARQAGMIGERKRLAREIHDTLIQGFASIVMNLEAAEGSLEELSRPFSRHLDEARATAREGLAESRRIVWALRPEALEGAPLSEALSRLAARWSEAADVEAEVAVTGAALPLPAEVEVTLLRAAQEALTNVRKHALARRTVLTLSYMGDRVTLDVTDDGQGFEPGDIPAADDSGGFGLRAMRERIEGVGGTLLVESESGGGTTLAVEVPATGAGRGERDGQATRGAP